MVLTSSDAMYADMWCTCAGYWVNGDTVKMGDVITSAMESSGGGMYGSAQQNGMLFNVSKTKKIITFGGQKVTQQRAYIKKICVF